jgi:hypothetical protein
VWGCLCVCVSVCVCGCVCCVSADAQTSASAQIHAKINAQTFRSVQMIRSVCVGVCVVQKLNQCDVRVDYLLPIRDQFSPASFEFEF